MLLAVAFLPAGVIAYAAGPAMASPPALRTSGVSMLQEVDKSTWCQQVDAASALTVVFFYAPWCRTCKAVRPKLERLERAADANFLQVNFKRETELCYREKVFSFPTVHFYLPQIGRVSRATLTASNVDEKVRAALDRFAGGRPQERLLQQIAAEAIKPVVQYTELVGALQALAELSAGDLGGATPEGTFGAGVNVKKESARLRTMVESDEERLAELEALFHSLDTDHDGRLRFSELEAAVAALGDDAQLDMEASWPVVDHEVGDGEDAPMGIDQSTFVSLMIDKAVSDFAAGENALLPAFHALDKDGDGTVSQAQLLQAIDTFCQARPDAEGCEIGQRKFKLAQAFEAFANDRQLLDYERFVEMVSGRQDGVEECEVVEMMPGGSSYLDDEGEMMGERECFGQAVDEQGDDDLACDAWFYGEDPHETKEKVITDPEKIAALRASGAAAVAERIKREADMAKRLQARQTVGIK